MFHQIGLPLTVMSLLLIVSGCGESPRKAVDTSWKVVDADALTATQIEQKTKGIAAKDAMFNHLLGRLMKAIGDGGPGNAISVCQEDAPKIAQQIATVHGVRIGRTASKLRNRKNESPSWAKSLVEKGSAEASYLANSKGDLAVLLPIKLQQTCLLCHGPAEQIPAPVKEALAKRYPDDQAIGYKEGDLRGWFWIEIPMQ